MITLDNGSINSAFKSVKLNERKESTILVRSKGKKQNKRNHLVWVKSYFAQLQKYNNSFFERETIPMSTWSEFIIQKHKKDVYGTIYSTWRIVHDVFTYVFLFNS